MPEISLLQIGAVTAAIIIGVVLGWSSRGSRSAREKSAINAGWQEQLEAKNLESERLQSQNKSLMEQVSRFQNADRQAGKQVKKLTAELADAAEHRGTLERQVDGLRNQLKRAIADVNQLTKDPGAQPSAEKDAKIAELNSALKQWQSRVPTLVEKFRQRDEEAGQLAAELAEARQTIDELRSASVPAALDADIDAERETDTEAEAGDDIRREGESEGNVVSISFADRKRPSLDADSDEANEIGREAAGSLKDADAVADADIVDAGINLDQEIAGANADEQPEDETDDDYTIEGTSLDEDELFTGSFATATDDDTGQSRFERSRTPFDPDSVFAPDDEADSPADEDLRGNLTPAANPEPETDEATGEVGPSTDTDTDTDTRMDHEADDNTIEAPFDSDIPSHDVAPTDDTTVLQQAPSSDHDDANVETAASAVDTGAYEDHPDDDAGEGLRDNLKRINGIGPAIEKTLNELGIFRYRQVADLTDYDLDRIERRLDGFRSRIERENWMEQAQRLLDELAGETA